MLNILGILSILVAFATLAMCIIGVYCKFYRLSLVSCMFFILSLCTVCSISIKRVENETNNFKPLYHVDPKQDNYIILNGEQYDTVPYGHLEEYIVTDNL